MNGKKIVSIVLLLALSLTLLSGCGSNNTVGNENKAEGMSASGSGENTGPASTALGRYVEEVSDLSDRLSGYGNQLYQLANGNQVITDMIWDFAKSGDNGKSWMTDKRRWRTGMMEDNVYIFGLAIGADNTVGVIHLMDDDIMIRDTGEDDDAGTDESAGEDIDTAVNDDLEADDNAEAVDNETADDEEEGSGFPVEIDPTLLLILPDNTEIPVEIELTEDDECLYQVYIADNGRIFASVLGSGNLYEVTREGESELFLTLEYGRPETIKFQDDLMVIDGYGYDGLIIYDMEEEEYIEDEVLAEFVNENYADRGFDRGSSNATCFFFGEDNILYFAGAKGLYRHILGGSVMEQVIDGNLCSLGNPAYGLQGMLALENNEFLALFAGSRLVHYVYDPDIPTVPSEKLSVYSLEDNKTIRQAISLYQTKYPEVYIELEFALSNDNSVSREDALKNLNTRIMAGEGPDLLILDDMPVDSYIEKGLLLDLSADLDSLSGEDELFGNIIDAVRTDGKVYAMPCEVWLPIMLTKGRYVSQVNDLEDIADMVERLRNDNPGKDLFGFCTEKSIMRLFSMSCVPAWTTADGEIDKAAVKEFFSQIKRIYDAQMDGMPEEAIEEQEEINDYYARNFGVTYDDTEDIRRGTDVMSYVGGLSQLTCGVFCDFYGYMMADSVPGTENFEDSKWVPMNGQSSNVFCAKTLLGISTASQHIERAEDFLKMCFGKESQSYLQNGLAVNKAAFESNLAQKEENDSELYGSYTLTSDEGLFIQLVLYYPDERSIADLKQCMEKADTPYIKNDILENSVYEEGIAYLQGTRSLEEAADNVEKKAAIYMAE